MGAETERLDVDVKQSADYPPDMSKDVNGAPKQTSKGRSSKELILECAIDLIGEGGYSALSISAVCKRAEVSPTSIYWHFGDKAGLMTAAVKHTLKHDFALFMTEFEKYRTVDTLIDAYQKVLRAIIVNERPSSWAVLSTLAEGRQEAPEIDAVVREGRAKQFAFARQWGEEVCKYENPDAFADLIVSFNIYAANAYRMSRDAAEVDRILSSMRLVMLLMAEKRMARVVDDEDFTNLMIKWGFYGENGKPAD